MAETGLKGLKLSEITKRAKKTLVKKQSEQSKVTLKKKKTTKKRALKEAANTDTVSELKNAPTAKSSGNKRAKKSAVPASEDKEMTRHEVSEKNYLKRRDARRKADRRPGGRNLYERDLKEQKRLSVLKLTNMPDGFEEEQMKKFFNQFGFVTRINLQRNRYGRSKHEGFVEFEGKLTAGIAAKSVNGTMLYGTVIGCSVIPAESVTSEMFLSTEKERAKANRELVRNRLEWRNASLHANCVILDPEWVDLMHREDQYTRKQHLRRGIDYSFPGFKGLLDQSSS